MVPVPSRFLPLAIGCALLAGCGRPPAAGPIEVSVIGDALGAPGRADGGPLAPPAEVLVGATGQGLVRFDAGGQVVPGLATRWIVTGNGRSLIFRLPDALGEDQGSASVASLIARRLRAATLPDSRNPLKPLLGAIDDVDAVTPQVIDIELKAPRPNMLQLLAQPALAFGGRSGPFRMEGVFDGVAALRPLPPPDADAGEEAAPPPPRILLRGEPARRAVARFAGGHAALVLGGRFTDLPIARAAGLAGGALRFDPVSGLFGLAFRRVDEGLTADPLRRRALAMAIDRDRIARTLAVPGWIEGSAIVGPGTAEIAQPVQPDWADMALADRQAVARGTVAAWHAAGHADAPLRVAMPPGPGARELFALLLADWRAIGVDAVAVGPDQADADLRLVDEVAPADIASFYLRRFACDRGVPCTPMSDAVLVAAREAPTLMQRAALLAQADQLVTETVPFIAFGAPVRWSLVAPGLDLYRESPRAIHPLNELRSPLKR